MNAELIRQYHETGNLKALTSLFEALTDQRNRAEFQTQIYLHQIKLLSTKFSEITEPASGRRISEPRGVTSTSTSKPKPKTSTVEAMEL